MLPSNPIGIPFVELDETDSSNMYAMRLIQANMAGHGAAFFAHFQTAGRGQRGKTWSADPGQNIILSCVLEPAAIQVENKFLVSAVVALACRDLLLLHTVDDVCIKWPNDIYWKDRKAGGILVENILQGKDWKFAVAGIGININQTRFAQLGNNAVSLRQITGRTFNTVSLARELCTLLENKWQSMLLNKPDMIIQEFNNALYKRNQQVVFRKDNALFTAIVKGVNLQGELQIEMNGVDSTIVHGSAEWVVAL